MTSLSRSTIYEYMALEMFPKSIPIGKRRRGWLEHQIIEWITIGPFAWNKKS